MQTKETADIRLSYDAFEQIFDDPSFFLPIRWDGNDFAFTLSELFNRYTEKVRAAVPGMDIRALKNDCRLIVNAVKHYLNGLPSTAFDSVVRLMKKLNERRIQYAPSMLEENDPYYGDNMYFFRVTAVPDNKPYQRSRIFHTPYNMRSRVGTNRYSIAGYPSLYLGSSLELCCEEIHVNPHDSFALASRFELNGFSEYYSTVFDIIDLAVKPQDFLRSHVGDPIWQNDTLKRRRIAQKTLDSEEVRGAYLWWFPLIAACSYIRVDKKAPFAAEYIIPQMLMQWIRSETRREDTKIRLLTGIRYFSCASVRASDMGFNFVFPASGRELPDMPFCSVLAEAMRLTRPQYLHEFPDVASCERALVEDKELNLIYYP